MTNAAALALAYLRDPDGVRLHVSPICFPAGPLASAAFIIDRAFFHEASRTTLKPLLSRARLCENHLRERGEALRADRMAAIARLFSWGFVRSTILSINEEGLILLADRDGVPVMIASAKSQAGARIPRHPKTGHPEVSAVLFSIAVARERIARTLPPTCPVCLREVSAHASACPMSAPVDPKEVDTSAIR